MFNNRFIENEGQTCHKVFNYKVKIYETTNGRKAERDVVTHKNMAHGLAVCHK